MFLKSNKILYRMANKRLFSLEQKFERLSKQIEESESLRKKSLKDFTQETKEDPSKDVYSHPLDNAESPLTLTNMRTEELFQDMVGPEQVSAHNESFFSSRKVLLTYLGSLFGLSYGINFVNMDWVSLSMALGTMTHFVLFYFLLEGRKYLFAPV